MSGISFLSFCNLIHGDSFKNLYATSYVAPPHISSENKSFIYASVAGAACKKS